MRGRSQEIQCAACHCQLAMPAHAKLDDRVFCPFCGEGDSLQNVLTEVKQYAEERFVQQIQDRLRDLTRGTPCLEFMPPPQPSRRYRFVVELGSV